MAQLSTTSLFSDGNLVSYYKLEDVSDSKGSNTLTNNGTTPFNQGRWVNGADGGSANTTKYLSRASNLGITGNFSVSLWVKLTTEITSGVYGLFALDGITTSVSAYVEYQYNSGTRRLAFTRARSGSSFDQITHNITLGNTDWHHIVITYDGSTVRGYVDNTATSTVASSGNGTNTDATQGFCILALRDYVSGAISSYCSGIIDDVGIFSKKLSTTEIAELYDPSALTFTNSLETSTGTEAYSYINGRTFDLAETSTGTESYVVNAPRQTWNKQSKSSSSWTNQSQS